MSKLTHNYLVTMPYGIGDTVHIGLAVIDQILKQDSIAKIDVIANSFQSEILEDDPRINLIEVEKDIFPTQNKATWYKCFFIFDKRAKSLRSKHLKKKYDFIFPGNAAFGFLHSLRSKVLYPKPLPIIRDYFDLKQGKNAQASRRVRSMIYEYYTTKREAPKIGEKIDLYIKESTFEKARRWYEKLISKKTGTKTILVAPDTTSAVTRPPTQLLADILISLLRTGSLVNIIILPSYTDTTASKKLFLRLKDFDARVTLIPNKPRPSLLLSAALCDLVDIVLTGDTGIMHLSASWKVIASKSRKGSKIYLKNRVNTIALFGGTSPGLYGHPIRSTIIGRGHPAQKKIRPGFFKEGYIPKDEDYFYHIDINFVVKKMRKLLAF